MGSNITLRLDEKTIQRIKHIAVDRQMSVSAWVGGLVSRAVDELDGFELARSRARQAMAAPAPVQNASVLERDESHER